MSVPFRRLALSELEQELENLEREITKLTQRRTKLKNKIASTKRSIENPPDSRFVAKPEERYVVAAVELKPLIQRWLDKGTTRYGSGYTIRDLARKAKVDDNTIKSILKKEGKFVFATTADKILVALELPYIRLTEVPNPKLKPFTEEEC